MMVEYEPKLMFPYVIRALRPLEVGFEFLLNIQKHKKSARVFSWSWLKLRVVFELLDLVYQSMFIN